VFLRTEQSQQHPIKIRLINATPTKQISQKVHHLMNGLVIRMDVVTFCYFLIPPNERMCKWAILPLLLMS
jgi:hypothetical protein